MHQEEFFYEKTWVRFNAKQNIRLLLGSGDHLFYQQKEITFYALAAWAITGRTKTLTKNAICLGLTAALIKAERYSQKLGASGAAASSFVPMHIGGAFFEQAYWPIGGLATIAKASSPKRHGEVLQSQSRGLIFSLEMMRILHFVYDRADERGRFELSVVKAANATDKVTSIPGGHGQHHLRRHWGRFSKRIALLYAASNVLIENGTTLLDEMFRHQPRYGLCESHIADWVSKARFVLTILEKCPGRSGDNAFTNVESIFDANERNVPSETPSKEFAVHHAFSDTDIAAIESTFSSRRGRPQKPSA